MSAQKATPSPVRVDIGGRHYEGRFRADSGVLTVWYGNSAKSVALRYPEPEFQAKLLLTQMVMSAASDPGER